MGKFFEILFFNFMTKNIVPEHKISQVLLAIML